MTNSAELELTDSTQKFISVGNQTFLNSKGKTEICRKGLRGEHCKRHHGGSITSFADARAKLDAYAERTTQKLSNFENGCIWLYSVLMGISIEEARQRYINSTAMYSLIGVKKPTNDEVKGLQKILLKLADISHNTSTRMDKLKRLIKKMTVGNGFSEAGFYSLKDMVKDSALKFKIGVAGTTLGGTLLLTGCSNNPVSDTISALTLDQMRGDSQAGDQLIFAEEVTDDMGTYTRTYVELPKDFKNSDGKALTGEALTVAQLAVKFASLEAIDSIALDNPNRWEEWKANVAPTYLHSGYINDILNAGPDSGALIFKQDGSNLPTLIRDGGVRVADKKITDVQVAASSDGRYEVTISGNALVYTTDASASKWFTDKTKSSVSESKYYHEDGTEWTPEEIAEWQGSSSAKAAVPDAFKDGKDNATVISYNMSYTLLKDGDAWKIAGYGSSFSHEQPSLSATTQQQLDYRTKIKK